MRTFDLSAALRGEKVVTRDGREVTTVLQPDGVTEEQSVVVVLNGIVQQYCPNGSFYTDGRSHDMDLFMASKTVTMFSNIYRYPTGEVYGGLLHETAADAEKNAIVFLCKDHIALATVTWEE
jgi:hypothetical protein